VFLLSVQDYKLRRKVSCNNPGEIPEIVNSYNVTVGELKKYRNCVISQKSAQEFSS